MLVMSLLTSMLLCSISDDSESIHELIGGENSISFKSWTASHFCVSSAFKRVFERINRF